MKADIARNLHKKALEYLDKAITQAYHSEILGLAPRGGPYHKLSAASVYHPANFMIDSVVLWSAQYALGYTVDIVTPLLNYMVPTESYLRRFLPPEYEAYLAKRDLRSGTSLTSCVLPPLAPPSASDSQTGEGEHLREHVIVASSVEETWCGEAEEPFPYPLPALVHFSSGSHLTFEWLSEDGGGSQVPQETVMGDSFSPAVSTMVSERCVAQTKLSVQGGSSSGSNGNLTVQMSLLELGMLSQALMHCESFYHTLRGILN